MDFRNAIGTVHVAFHALGLSTVKIDEIKNQKTFPTDELHKILKEVDDVKQELQEKEKQRQVLENQLQKKKINNNNNDNNNNDYLFLHSPTYHREVSLRWIFGMPLAQFMLPFMRLVSLL